MWRVIALLLLVRNGFPGVSALVRSNTAADLDSHRVVLDANKIDLDAHKVAKITRKHDVHEGTLAGWAGIHSAGHGNTTVFAKEHTDAHKGSSGTVSLKAIFALCIVMYGGIACLWFFFTAAGGRGDGENAKDSMQAFKVLLLCVSWASCSVGMHVLNKSLSVKLQAPALISMVQMAIAVGVVGAGAYENFRTAERKQLARWLIVPCFFASMLCTSFYTYQYISLSLLTVIRNLTPLVVLPIERMIMPAGKGPKISFGIVGSIFIMLAGALLYAGGLKNLSVMGIVFAIVNMVLAMSDRLIQRRLLTGECKDLSSGVCTVMNNFWGMIPTVILALCTHQIQDASKPAHSDDWKDVRVIILLILSGCVGIGICYLGFECQRAITATSFFVLQNVSKVAVVIAGVVLFKDPLKNAMSIIGLLLSLGGSFLYGLAQMHITRMEKLAKEKAVAKGESSEINEPKKV